MSDNDELPRVPRMPSIPKGKDHGRELADTAPPSEEDPIELMIELKAALANVGELCTKLSTRLSRVQLAMLANEHKANTGAERAAEALALLGKAVTRIEAIE